MNEGFSREQLLDDAGLIFTAIEAIHPDPYHAFDPSAAALARHTLEDLLRDGMTRLEFWRLAAPVVAHFRDGHTRLGAPEEEWNHVWSTGSNVFPLVLAFEGSGATVRADLSGDGFLPPGTRIRRINGRPVAELVREGTATLSFERDAVRLWALNRRQTANIFFVWGWTGPFGVAAELVSGEAVTATLPAISSEAWLSAAEAAGLRAAGPSPPPYSFSIEADGQLGYLDFRSHSDPVAFKRFLEEAFSALREHSPRALLIDLRHNAGGSSELNDPLVEYLTDRPVRQFSRMNVRASAAVKEQHRARLPRPIRWLPAGAFRLLHRDLGALLSAPDGAIVHWIPEETSAGRNRLRWHGPVFALVGLNTFSAAADLAAMLQDYELATIVGEETGGLASSYGDFLRMPLPHSQLTLDVSTKFYLRPSGVVDRRGVVPDLLVPATGDGDLSDDPAIQQIVEVLATEREAAAYMAEIEALCEREGGRLWGVSLCGPVVLADPATGKVVTNRPEPDAPRPRALGYANAAMQWGDDRWVTLVWPFIPADPTARGILFLHELFHRVQPDLGLYVATSSGENDHLDTPEGRYWMQLEWRALARALETSGSAREEAVRDALAFRMARRAAFPAAAEREAASEINEGLAQYTGTVAAAESARDAAASAVRQLRDAPDRESFVRTFAYASGAAYGLLLDDASPGWRNVIRITDDLGAMLMTALDTGPTEAPRDAAPRYGGPELRAMEEAREAERQVRVDELRRRFVDGPVLVLPRGRNASFITTGVTPIPGAGTIYPRYRVTGAWGTIEAEAVLVSPDGTTLTVPAPADPDLTALAGEGWTITLADGWTVQPGPRPDDFMLVREK